MRHAVDETLETGGGRNLKGKKREVGCGCSEGGGEGRERETER